MKKMILVFTVLLSAVLSLAGCNGKLPEEISGNHPLQSIYTDKKAWNTDELPQTAIINTHAELMQYFAENKDNFYLCRRIGDSPSFLDAIKKYDATFFENNFLVIHAFTEESSSFNHELASYEMENGKLEVIVKKAADTSFINFRHADCHIILEVPKSVGTVSSVSFEFIQVK